MAKKKRTKVTPRWLSIARKIMIYLGGSTFLIMLFAKLFPDKSTQDLAMQGFLTLLGIVQLVCDMSYQKDPLEDMPADPVNPQIKE